MFELFLLTVGGGLAAAGLALGRDKIPPRPRPSLENTLKQVRIALDMDKEAEE